MRIRVSCVDQERLWVLDEVINGLFSVDLKTFETECVIDGPKLFQYGKYEIQSMMNWGEECIIMIPREIDKDWIFYNKATGEIRYSKIIKRKYQERLIATVQDVSRLYFFPLSIYEPALVVDMNTLVCVQVIEDWSDRSQGDCSETSWTGTYNKKYVFYPKKGTKFLIQIDCQTQKRGLIELDISENIADVNYAFGELWILPVSGDKLYQIDESGRVVNMVKLSVEGSVNPIPNFAKIIVQKKYLFLLPCYRKGIYVYDKLKEKIYIIPEENLDLEGKSKENYLKYWNYCVIDNQICFLPYLDKYIEIDLDTLTYQEKELLYPSRWSDEEKIQRCIWSNISEDNYTIRGASGCELEIFLNYIQYKRNIEGFSKVENKGRKIWNALTVDFS